MLQETKTGLHLPTKLEAANCEISGEYHSNPAHPQRNGNPADHCVPFFEHSHEMHDRNDKKNSRDRVVICLFAHVLHYTASPCVPAKILWKTCSLAKSCNRFADDFAIVKCVHIHLSTDLRIPLHWLVSPSKWSSSSAFASSFVLWMVPSL